MLLCVLRKGLSSESASYSLRTATANPRTHLLRWRGNSFRDFQTTTVCSEKACQVGRLHTAIINPKTHLLRWRGSSFRHFQTTIVCSEKACQVNRLQWPSNRLNRIGSTNHKQFPLSIYNAAQIVTYIHQHIGHLLHPKHPSLLISPYGLSNLFKHLINYLINPFYVFHVSVFALSSKVFCNVIRRKCWHI